MNLKRLFDLDAVLPADYGQAHDRSSPRFFAIECFLILPTGLFLASAVMFAGFMFLEFVGMVEPVNSSYNFWNIPIIFLALGLFGLYSIHALTHRRINNEQYEWMLSVHRDLHLPKPRREMNKQDLKTYVEAAYYDQSQKQNLIDR